MPSQKELAAILRITPRHLRRWELAEGAAGRAFSRPYSHADLWRLYQLRRGKGWDRAAALSAGVGDVFERFEAMSADRRESSAIDSVSEVAALMLSTLAKGENVNASGVAKLPRCFGLGVAQAAKDQLVAILDCDQARRILVNAFFEAALVADEGNKMDSDEPKVLLSA